jgi:hypothetical protein
MSPDAPARGLTEGCMVETAEGPVAMRDTPKKGFAVMTRTDDGGIGFRQLIRLEHASDVPLVRIGLDNGHAIVVARDHTLFTVGLEPVAACALSPGDQLETAFRYPDGYLPTGRAEVSAAWGVAVTSVEEAGNGPVMFGTVRDTHRLFLTAGVLCGE